MQRDHGIHTVYNKNVMRGYVRRDAVVISFAIVSASLTEIDVCITRILRPQSITVIERLFYNEKDSIVADNPLLHSIPWSLTYFISRLGSSNVAI